MRQISETDPAGEKTKGQRDGTPYLRSQGCQHKTRVSSQLFGALKPVCTSDLALSLPGWLYNGSEPPGFHEKKGEKWTEILQACAWHQWTIRITTVADDALPEMARVSLLGSLTNTMPSLLWSLQCLSKHAK